MTRFMTAIGLITILTSQAAALDQGSLAETSGKIDDVAVALALSSIASTKCPGIFVNSDRMNDSIREMHMTDAELDAAKPRAYEAGRKMLIQLKVEGLAVWCAKARRIFTKSGAVAYGIVELE